MKIDNMVDNLIMYLNLYRLHSKKIFNKMNNQDMKALLLISYKEDDILNNIKEIINNREIFKEYLNENNYRKAYMVYRNIKDKYDITEKILIDRIEEIIKIRALDIMKSTH
ncbi:hypothetical protein MJ1_0202 [Nanobdella aerobiophila]|uniref:Uncharacterized protein n=1 Tax=Nanobdella aerobiophila TaxID=2586965 RepID=A0A915SCG7_9ARCH|nr:hypothetical protein [Nanobdella aerobiophila]BBL45373.1 hypothetical protein MJ1_0202 [Nanobdella aerobiophila]